MNQPTAEWYAYVITDENKDELRSEFDPQDVMSADNLPTSPRTFVPGMVAIIRLITADDPFVASLGNRFNSVWIATQDQFDSKFRVTGCGRYSPSRLLITPK